MTGKSPHHLTKQKKSHPSLGNENGAEGPESSALGVRYAKLFRKSHPNNFKNTPWCQITVQGRNNMFQAGLKTLAMELPGRTVGSDFSVNNSCRWQAL
jgi:hypothetical protein